uniref:Variant surface glycoprotein 1125.5202 n=1 Tax=Trypanosoma brucei TaxID=5691 RepID=A0A1J0RC54_9TRYP|nr:variant surface glycoprotein 1125.5202 [Trypanosoma brucei]
MTNKAAITKSKTVATALVVVVAAAFLAVDQAKGAAPTKGDNAAAFSSLCLAINSALKPKLPPPINTEADNILNFAAAVNLTTIGSEGLSDVVSKHQKTAGDLQKDSIQSKVCEGVHWEFCSKGGKKAAELKANGDFQALRNAQISPANKLKIIATVAAIKEAAEQIQSTKTAAEDKTIATELAEALYGQQQEPAEIKLATAETNRQAACGRTSTSTQGSLAVGSLVGTALCLCAKDSQQTAANACTTETKYDLQIAADADINVKSDWELLKTACDAQATETTGTPEAIAAALATLTANTAAKKSSGNYVNVLGHLPGNGAGGCDGAADGTNGGACAYYGKADETGGVGRTKWA